LVVILEIHRPLGRTGSMSEDKIKMYSKERMYEYGMDSTGSGQAPGSSI
jgi:hypothetical protein